MTTVDIDLPRWPQQLIGVTVNRTSPVPSSSSANRQNEGLDAFACFSEWLNPNGIASFVLFVPSADSAVNSS